MNYLRKTIILLVILIINGLVAWITNQAILSPIKTSINKIKLLHLSPISSHLTHKIVKKNSALMLGIVNNELIQHHILIKNLALNHKKNIVILISSFIELLHILQRLIALNIHCSSITIGKTKSSGLLKTKIMVAVHHE